jgi:hypothetical protein
LTDFGPFIEALTAAYQIGNVAVRQSLLNSRRLSIDSKEDGHIPKVDAARSLLGKPVTDCSCFGRFIG